MRLLWLSIGTVQKLQISTDQYSTIYRNSMPKSKVTITRHYVFLNLKGHWIRGILTKFLNSSET